MAYVPYVLGGGEAGPEKEYSDGDLPDEFAEEEVAYTRRCRELSTVYLHSGHHAATNVSPITDHRPGA